MMLPILLLFAPLIVQLAAIYVLSGYVNRVLYRRLGKSLYLLIMWPGVIVHELSHLAACLLTATKVFEVKLFAPHEESGSLVLGYVRHAQPRGPVSAALIGAAPFFGGAAALWISLKVFFPTFVASGAFTLAALLSLVARFEWTAWTTYVFLYLVLVLSCHIAPSKPDIISSLKGVVGLLVLAWIFVAVDRYFDLAAAATAVAWASRHIGSVNVLLSYGLAFTLILAVVAFLLEGSGRLARRRPGT